LALTEIKSNQIWAVKVLDKEEKAKQMLKYEISEAFHLILKH
jgi:hypothetical protein